MASKEIESEVIVGLDVVKGVKGARLLKARHPAIIRVATNTCAPWIPNSAFMDVTTKAGETMRCYINDVESIEIRTPEGTYDEDTKEVKTDQKR